MRKTSHSCRSETPASMIVMGTVRFDMLAWQVAPWQVLRDDGR